MFLVLHTGSTVPFEADAHDASRLELIMFLFGGDPMEAWLRKARRTILRLDSGIPLELWGRHGVWESMATLRCYMNKDSKSIMTISRVATGIQLLSGSAFY